MNSSLITNSQPRFGAVGDFNNDHQMDIVVANSGTDTIGIFISNSDGTFANQTIYSTSFGSRPSSVVLADFNNDNYLDIAVANYGTNNIGIFLGNENGIFADQKLVSLGSSHPLFVNVSDFNNDNQMDLVVVNYGTNNIGILLGYGNGSFQNQLTYFTGYDSIPYSVALGDFNNDHQIDIAVANYGTNNIGIFLGYNNGTFANQIIYTTNLNSHPSSIAVGDFNNDHHLDIVVANSGTYNIGILFGYGNGSFLSQITYTIGSNSYLQYITVGDVNKDNKLDIIIVDSKNDEIDILPGYGNGSFATIITYDGISGSNPMWTTLSDFNNNNQSDLVVVNYGTNNVLVLLDYFEKSSARQMNYLGHGPSTVTSVAVSDFNNDHILDIVFNSVPSIIILYGLGNGTFGRETTYSTGIGSIPQYVCTGDLNNDNRMDIVIADTGLDGVDVFLGYGNRSFGAMITYSTGIASFPVWVALGDVNNDHILDIVSANMGTGTIGILLGNGDGTFNIMMTYFNAYKSQPNSVAIGDINNDNNSDLVVANNDDSIDIFLGYGNSTFVSWNVSRTVYGSNPLSIALADFNSDNYLDIVVADTFTNNVGIFLGYGNGNFTEETTYSTGFGSQPYYVIVADFNSDNISDIAATNLGTDEIVIFYGFGNGSFELKRNYSTEFGSSPYGMVAADLDNDQHLEIVVALFGTGDIAILTEYNAAEFINQTIYSTGSAPQPYSVVVGDFNNDNRLDIVVANSGTNNLGILFGLTNDTFSIEMMYPIGINSHPQYVISCDINKDNQLDIISVNSKINSISVIMGYGNGSFAQEMMYSTGDGSYPYAIVSGDINNDNRLDLVVANVGTNSIGIFFGFDYTSFWSQQTYSSSDNWNPDGIVVSDFNNDNILDIAAVFYTNNTVGILLGYGNGSFTSMMMTYSTGIDSGPTGIVVGDFNNDSRLDIVVVNWNTCNMGVLLGNDNGSFADIMTYSTGNNSNPAGVTVGDFDNDSRLDIVVANYGSNNIGIFLGYGNGSFAPIITYSTGELSTPYSVAVGDFNDDSNLDIAVANYGTSNIGVFLGYSNGTFRNQVTFRTSMTFANLFWITVGDFNSDNQLDIATADSNVDAVGIWLGDGHGTFAQEVIYRVGNGSRPFCLSVGDFNNDKILDIAVANDGTNNIVILFGFGDGTFLLGTAYSTGFGSLPWALVDGDFNKDGQLDIAVINWQSSNIGIFLGHGSQPFAGIALYSTDDGSQPHSVAIGDFNNDGYMDLVVANYGTDNVGIFLGLGDGFLDTMMRYPTGNGSAPYSVAVSDFNNDTHLDIVVTNSQTDNIAILLGYGNGTFVIRMTYSTGTLSQPYIFAIGDLNNDHILDIAIANAGTSNIYLLYGYGNGTFGNDTYYPLGYEYQPYSIALGDLNGDGLIDIIIACYGTDHVETLIKMC